jgi:phosphocarrier protein
MIKVKRKIEIRNKHGLHARAAALLVQTVSRFSADVKISKDGQVVEAKGQDAEEAVSTIEELIGKRFHEGD